MFHEGNLQSGISLAIQEQKLVGIFVRDDGLESSTWENDWLQSGWLANLLERSAVLLRLEAGSTEAGFLSAFCTLSSIPSFVVIQNGQLKEQLASGVSKDEFINRVRKVLGASPIPGSAQPPPATLQTSPASPTEANPPVARAPVPTPRAPISRTPAPAPSPAPIATPPPTAKDKGKQKAVVPDPNAEATKLAKQAARDSLRKNKQGEKDELARIKAKIEADKAARKAQAEARKADRERLAQNSPTASQPAVRTSTRGSQAKQVNLNVRLFDGQTIRSTFPRTAKLQDDVRPWIDQEFAARAENANDTHPPYYFRQILAPLPSREVSAGEEADTLGDIDLAPSATLVLIPVKGYNEAYSGGGGGIVYGATGNVMGLVGGAFNLAGSAIGYMGSTLSSLVGGGESSTQASSGQPSAGRSLGEVPPSQQQQQQQQQATDTSNVRVRTLADQRARDPGQQFYNGNQLDTVPRDEDSRR